MHNNHRNDRPLATGIFANSQNCASFIPDQTVLRGRGVQGSQGGLIFFFFFIAASSPHYGSPEFLHFCATLERIRVAYPTLTVSALRTVCIVASAGQEGWVSYDEITHESGLAHTLAIHQIVHLCADDKSGKQSALLIKREEQDRRFRSVLLSEAGKSVAAWFLPSGMTGDANSYIRDCILPALQIVMNTRPALALGTLTVLLYVARNQDRFGFEGKHIREVSKNLGISNLTRHFNVLSKGPTDTANGGLVTLITNSKDKRAKLPEVTVEGHAFVAQIAAALIGELPVAPRHPSEAQIERLPVSSDVDKIEWDELTALDGWDDIVWHDERDKPSPEQGT